MEFSLGSSQRLAALQILLLQFFLYFKRKSTKQTVQCSILLPHDLKIFWHVTEFHGYKNYELLTLNVEDLWQTLNGIRTVDTAATFEVYCTLRETMKLIWMSDKISRMHIIKWYTMGDQCIRVIQNAYLWKRLEGTFFFKGKQKEEPRGGWLPFIMWCWTTLFVSVQK